MKTISITRKCVLALGLAALLSITTACGDNDVPSLASVEDVEQETDDNETASDKVSDVSEEIINDEVIDKTNDNIVDKTDKNNEDDTVIEPGAIDEEQCVTKIDELLATDSVLPAESELLAEMAKCVTFARILDEKGMIFSEMDSDKQGALRTQAFKDIMWGETAFTGAIEIKDGEGQYEADILIPVDEAVAFFKDMYGADDFTKDDHRENIEDGYILWSNGDGDPWEIIDHMQFFEDDNYYLLTGPAFFESNGGESKYMGYADILFVKNPESRYGVTLLYGRYRSDKIIVTSVDATSELPAANGKNYSAKNLIDGNYSTAWVEGVSGVGVGETITLHLDKAQKVFGIQICNGYTADYDLYTKNGMLESVKVDFGKGKVIEENVYGYGFEDIDSDYLAELNLNRIELAEPVVTDTITITITSASVGAKYDDTCVSEIQVY